MGGKERRRGGQGVRMEIVRCDWCGKTLIRYKSHVKKHNFCSRECLNSFCSKAKNPLGYSQLKDYRSMSSHMTALNESLNSTRMTPETRHKLRISRLNSGSGKSYEKTYGRHTHRIVAERMLGRSLLPDEIVHHIDGNKRNNNPKNLAVMTQSEHARLHAKQKAR